MCVILLQVMVVKVRKVGSGGFQGPVSAILARHHHGDATRSTRSTLPTEKRVPTLLSQRPEPVRLLTAHLLIAHCLCLAASC